MVLLIYMTSMWTCCMPVEHEWKRQALALFSLHELS